MTLPKAALRRSPFQVLFRLAVPIVGVNVGMMLMGTVDTVMVGRVSARALAAVAIGNVFFQAIAMIGVGIMLALDPIVSQALGAADRDATPRAVQRGIILATLVTIPLTALVLAAEPMSRLLSQPDEVIPLVGVYARILAPSMLPFLLFTVGRQALQAMHRVAPVFWTIVAANLANVFLNQWLIFGGLGVPPLGVAGSAWATLGARLLMVAILVHLARADLLPLIRPWRRESRDVRALGRMLLIGIPIGIQLELEIGVFAAVALLMGTFGTVPVAAHQVAISLASLTFMVPMGVGMGAAVLVGHAVGRNDRMELRQSARSALLLGVGFMICTAVIFLAAPRFLATIYSTDAAVVAFAATLIPIAGVFQIFDGIQAVSVGILRGMGDTRVPMMISFLGFGIVGLSMAMFLAFRTTLGPRGLWWGLVLALATVAIILTVRVRSALKRPLVRLRG